jgi:hypothetical protein
MQREDDMDRAKLTLALDRTLESLQARDPSLLPLSPSVKYTENGQRLRVGQGLWATAIPGGIGARVIFAEPEAGQIGFFGTVRENGNPVVLALRLKVADGALTEIESVICRGHERIFDPAAMRDTRTSFGTAIPPAERASRDRLIACGNAYFDGIERGDGEIIPAAEDCARVENGVQTTLNTAIGGRPGFPLWGMPVAAQIGTGYYAYIEAIRDRRVALIDEERGLVLMVVCFDHPGNVKSVEVKGQGTIELPPFTQKPSTALIVELFQVRGDKITGIEAVLDFFPYGMRTGWE